MPDTATATTTATATDNTMGHLALHDPLGSQQMMSPIDEGYSSESAGIIRRTTCHESLDLDDDDDDDNADYFPPSPDLCLDSTELSDDKPIDKYAVVAFQPTDGTTIRLPSGKTILPRRSTGPHTSKHRPRRTSPTTSSTHMAASKKVKGNCAMIPNPPTASTATPTPREPELSSSSSELDTTSTPSSPSTRQTSSMSRRMRLMMHKVTVRSSDAQMLAGLPLPAQHALLATQQKTLSRVGRVEQQFRGKMDSLGNTKVKERFVNDVPGGRSHRNRFMAQ